MECYATRMRGKGGGEVFEYSLWHFICPNLKLLFCLPSQCRREAISTSTLVQPCCVALNWHPNIFRTPPNCSLLDQDYRDGWKTVRTAPSNKNWNSNALFSFWKELWLTCRNSEAFSNKILLPKQLNQIIGTIKEKVHKILETGFVYPLVYH